MKFDTVIIGGGLSGLTAGIDLAGAGRRVAIISAGQSSLHFSSGSLELMGYDAKGKPVEHPLEAIAALDAGHPYTRMGGASAVEALASRVAPMLGKAGVKVSGSHERNHWRLTPTGMFKPAWLSIDDYLTVDNPGRLPWRKVVIVNLKGFLDFFPRFLAAGLEPRGVECRMATVTVKALDDQRVSASEMRATNIARVLHGDAIAALAREVNRVAGDAEAVLFPAVAGFDNMEAAVRLRSLVEKPLHFVATMGTSVPGVRSQIMLQKHFRHLGGSYMLGDTVVKGVFNAAGTRLESVRTVNFESDPLEADTFIFAAGSFFSHGLTATPDGILEPVLGLDVPAPAVRGEWFDKDLFKPQPYMKLGVATDADFHALRGGKTVENLYVAGSSLAGADALLQGAGGGIAALTALHIASKIKA